MRSFSLASIFIAPILAFAAGGNLAGSGTADSPWQIADYEDLKMVGHSPYTMNGHYRLVADIDASASKDEIPSYQDTVTREKGFKPIGQLYPEGVEESISRGRTKTEDFSGSFNGAGYTITNLYVHNTLEMQTGLFSVVSKDGRVDSLTLKKFYLYGVEAASIAGENNGTINEVHVEADTLFLNSEAASLVTVNKGTLSNSSFKGIIAGAYIGGLVYENRGTISGSQYEGTGDKKNSRSNVYFGGIAFKNYGEIRDSKASGIMVGMSNVGGVATYNYGLVERCSTSADIYGTGGSMYAKAITNGNAVGGLVALDSGIIRDSYTSGNIYGSGSLIGGLVGVTMGEISGSTSAMRVEALAFSGGLVGCNYGKISKSTATGKVVGSANVGGLTGINFGSITDSHAEGDVDFSAAEAGGLASKNFEEGVIENCYATGNVVGTSSVAGGLVADNYGKISGSYAKGNVKGATSVGGLVGKMTKGSIEKSYSTGDVMGEFYVGGFVGEIEAGSVDQSYSTGNILDGKSNVGGFTGAIFESVSVTNSFAHGNVHENSDFAGLVASFAGSIGKNATVENDYSLGYASNKAAGFENVCATKGTDVKIDSYYWNISNCTVVDTAAYGIDLTSDQFKDAKSFSKFDFEKIWKMDVSFPILMNVPFDGEKKDTTGFGASKPEAYDPVKYGLIDGDTNKGSSSSSKPGDNGSDDGDSDGPKKIVPSVTLLQIPFTVRDYAGVLQASFTLQSAGSVEICILDYMGTDMGVTLKKSFGTGNHQVNLDAARVSQGRYLSIIRVNGKIVGKSAFVRK